MIRAGASISGGGGTNVNGALNTTQFRRSSEPLGGSLNAVLYHTCSSTVGGGYDNFIDYDSIYGTIVRRSRNEIGNTVLRGSIGGGGEQNVIGDGIDYATIPGGNSDEINEVRTRNRDLEERVAVLELLVLSRVR